MARKTEDEQQPEEQAAEQVTAVYRGESDSLVLSDGTELRRHEHVEADRAAVEAAQRAGHVVEVIGPPG